MSKSLLSDLVYQKYHWSANFLKSIFENTNWPNLTRSQLNLLGGVYFGVHQPNKLAEISGISRQAVSQLVKELESLELIQVKTNPEKRNSSIVELTSKGRECLDLVDEGFNKLERKLIEEFGEKTLRSTIRIMSSNWTEILEDDS